MSRFLELLRRENDMANDDLYAEEQREAQVQLSELWSILDNNQTELVALEGYITKWSHNADGEPKNLLFESVGPDGMKPLHWCCMKGFRPQIVECILQQNIDIDDTRGSAAGETPLLLAVNYAHRDIVEVLVAHGARSDLVDKFGNSPQAVVQKKMKSKNSAIREMYSPIATLLDGSYMEDVDKAHALREEGNTFFRDGQYKRAISSYTDSLRYAEDSRALSNRSQCYLELAKAARRVEVMELEHLRKLYRQALQDANASRLQAPEDIKGHFRAAVAFIGCGDFPSAVKVLHTALSGQARAGEASSLRLARSSINVQSADERRGVDALHDLLEELAVADVPLGDVPLELRPKAVSLILSPRGNRDGEVDVGGGGHSASTGGDGGGGRLDEEELRGRQVGDSDRRDRTDSGLICAWCEMPLPPPLTSREGFLPNSPLVEKCPVCRCVLEDRVSPARIRKKYLGPSPRDERIL